MPAGDLVARRNRRFWSQFSYQSRSLVTQFVNTLQSTEADVVMFTARKSACFADCLRLVQAWTPHSTICSDRALDFDRAWLQGKRVLLVDDVVGTGITAHRLLALLERLDVQQLTFLPMATRREWPSALDALAAKHPDASVLGPRRAPSHRRPQRRGRLGHQRHAAAVQHRLAAAVRLDRDPGRAGHLHVNSGWNARSLTSASQARADVRVMTLEPSSRSLRHVAPWLAAPRSVVGLMTIRVYAEPVSDGALAVLLMPIVAFDERDLTLLLPTVGFPAPASGDRPVGRARQAQYGVSLAVGSRRRHGRTLAGQVLPARCREIGSGRQGSLCPPAFPKSVRDDLLDARRAVRAAPGTSDRQRRGSPRGQEPAQRLCVGAEPIGRAPQGQGRRRRGGLSGHRHVRPTRGRRCRQVDLRCVRALTRLEAGWNGTFERLPPLAN